MKDKRGHFNYTYKLEDKDNPNSVIKGWWIETSINDASFYEWEAMVTGDQSDGINGLWKKGKAWCDKNFAGKSLKEVQHLVFDEYIKDYGESKGIYEFQKNYRLLHLLNCNEDFMREIDEIPTIPIIKEVVRDLQIENNNEINAEF